MVVLESRDSAAVRVLEEHLIHTQKLLTAVEEFLDNKSYWVSFQGVADDAKTV